MCVESATAYLVATWLRHHCLAEPCQQRADEHNRAAQACTAVYVLVAVDVVEVHVVGLEREAAHAIACYAHTHIHKLVYEVVHVGNVGYVFNGHLLGGEQRCANLLQHFVLGSLRVYFAFESVSSFDYK